MKYSIDRYPRIKQRVIELFSSNIDLSKLKIELSLKTCPLYNEYRDLFGVQHLIGMQLTIDHDSFPIIDLLGSYSPNKQRIMVYISNLTELTENFRFFEVGGFKLEFLIKLVTVHLIGRWICHRLKINDKTPSIKKFKNCGDLYKIFVSQMITYHLLNEAEKKLFLKFSLHLKDEYKVFRHFVRDFKIPENIEHDEISINELKEFIGTARQEEEEISQLFISNYFDAFIHRRVQGRKQYVLKKIRPILTAKQNYDFRFLSKEYGFFIE